MFDFENTKKGNIQNERVETVIRNGEPVTIISGEIQLDDDIDLGAPFAQESEVFTSRGVVYKSEGVRKSATNRDTLVKAEKLREKVVYEQTVLGAVRDLLLVMRGRGVLRHLSSEHFNMMKDALQLEAIVEYINFLSSEFKAKNEASAPVYRKESEDTYSELKNKAEDEKK